MIQQGLNQLLTQTAYFMQPIGERRRDEKAFKQAQEEAEKRVAQIMEITGTAKNLTDEQLEYSQNLQANAAKAQFERNPTEETLKDWTGAIKSKEEVMENIADDSWQRRAEQQIKQDIKFERLKAKLRKEAGLD